MIILTIDSKNKDIRLTSIGRDTYVDIPGYSTEKLNHSYAYEGPPLLLETINKNFGIPIDKYITVSFKSFMDIVDEIGGIEVNIDSKNIDIINSTINETYSIYNEDKTAASIKLIKNGGIQTINGYQALAFSRIRYTDNGYARDGRQREVILSAYKMLLKQDLPTIKEAVNIILHNCKTNIAPLEMVQIGIKAYNMKDSGIDQLEFPIASHREDIIKGEKGWVTEWDKEYNQKELKKFIYNYK
ncbi:LCP family protein [Romboutsia sp.]|uniref:LCP family protein n=1 Tax=Romboutsia sp. TaxID=1965302 RepID=UPI003F3B8614